MRRAQTIRIDRGLSAAELARRANVDWRTVRRLERGEPIRATSLRRLARVLRAEPAALLELDGQAHGIRELRERCALSIRDLSARTEVPVNVIYRAERDVAIAMHHALALSQYFGVPVSSWYPAEAAA